MGDALKVGVGGQDCWSRRTMASISEAVRSGLLWQPVGDVVPALGPGIVQGLADDALQRLVHGGMRAPTEVNRKPPQRVEEPRPGLSIEL